MKNLIKTYNCQMHTREDKKHQTKTFIHASHICHISYNIWFPITQQMDWNIKKYMKPHSDTHTHTKLRYIWQPITMPLMPGFSQTINRWRTFIFSWARVSLHFTMTNKCWFLCSSNLAIIFFFFLHVASCIYLAYLVHLFQMCKDTWSVRIHMQYFIVC